ncbi:MAG: peptidoglycan editing factor PgeF [Porphyromonadaceae bacterium]|nr:peptidoglycan editing factor PgeF [Porphyromonadaceae bacterium]
MKQHPQYRNLLQFCLLKEEKEIEHFSTTRPGGVSNGTYASFNMGNFSDDNPINIHENRQILARMFYTEMERFIIPHQTHGSRVLVIDEAFLALDQAAAIETMYGVDATITSKKGIFLCVTTADCIPIVLYDKKRAVIAAIHAGWRGTQGRIVEKTIEEMNRRYNSSPADILAGIGPGISQIHYEVGDEVADAFSRGGFDLSDEAVAFRKNPSSKWHLDLKEINRRELLRLGVSEENIEKSDLCTFEREELFFSARRQTQHSGRMLTGIMMKVTGTE